MDDGGQAADARASEDKPKGRRGLAWTGRFARPNAGGPVAPTPEQTDRVWLCKVRVLYAALIFANVAFAFLRGVDQLGGVRPTGYWINLVGAGTSLLLVLFFEGAPRRRFRVTLHVGLGLVGALLLAPAWFGYVSSPWWLVILPLAASAVMRAWEAMLWGALAMAGMVFGLVAVPALSPLAAAGEPVPEGIASRVFLVVIVTGLGLGVRRVMERGAEDLQATQRALEDTVQRLRAASEAKDVFLANVSHEIRTPLSGVIGLTELALSGPLPAEARDHVRTAHNSARAALVIVNDILDISKIESGRLGVEHGPVDLELTLRDTLQPLIAQARIKNLEVSCHVSPAIARYRIGDATRIGQIINNLVSNAIKFTKKGGVSIDMRPGAGAPEVLTIEVRDTGIGIPSDKLESVFEKFVQVDDSTTRVYGGTGLGLAIARELARLFGGDITVGSVLGQGSTFVARLALPIIPNTTGEEPVGVGLELNLAGSQPTLVAIRSEHTTPPNASPIATRRTPLASNKIVAGEPLKVLLAEDDPVSQLVLKQMLLRLGHSVTVTEDGVKAFQAFGAAPFDVLITDMQMPGMDGLELTRRVREAEAATGRHTMIFILSAHATATANERFSESEADAYLSKPVRLIELADALRGQARTADEG